MKNIKKSKKSHNNNIPTGIDNINMIESTIYKDSPYEQDVLMMEPKLREYLDRKKYYDRYNVIPSVPLEEQLGISKEEIKILKMYMEGGQMITEPLLVEMKVTKFPSEDLKNDRRLVQLREKMEKDKKLIEDHRNCRDIYKPMEDKPAPITYELPATDEERDLEGYKQPLFLDDLYFDVDARDKANYKPGALLKPKYIRPPRLQYNQTQHWQQYNSIKDHMKHDPKIIPVMCELDTYVDNTNTLYQHSKEMDHEKRVKGSHKNYIQEHLCYPSTAKKQPVPYLKPKELKHINKMIKLGKPYYDIKDYSEDYSYDKMDLDYDNKIMRPGKSSPNKKNEYINTSEFQPIPFMAAKAEIRDIDLETNVKCGYTEHGKRSYGYKNPSEHYFNYISDEIQCADSTVLPFPRGGIMTRDDNHATARPYYTREILQ